MMARMPIRWRLTLWYAGLTALALLLFGGALYFGLRANLYESLEDQIEAQERIARTGIVVDGSELALDDELTLLDDDAFVRLLSRDGDVVAQRSGEFDEVPVVSSTLSEALEHGESISTMQVDDVALRVRTVSIRQGDETVGALQVGLPSEDVTDTLNNVVSLVAIGAPILLALAIAGGYLMAGRTLAPVSAITRLAARISDRDLHTRLELDLPDDELGRLARTFDAMLARIESAFERQRRFTGDAAHELRTPLGLMRSQVDVALARPRSADGYRRALENLDEDLERLIRLVNTLLTLARADAGQLSLQVAPFDLADTIALVLEQYGPGADEAQVRLEAEVSTSPITADESLIMQALVNLLDNALAHTPAGGRVAAGCAPAGDLVRMWVSDTGSGIPAEHRQRVFDRFYRMDTGRTREAGGTGLGLAIAKAIAEAHGGTIAIADSNGPGTRVELVWPAGR
jgi:heavy metal sensor kinase